MTATADVIRSRIVERPLDIAALVAEVADPTCGATAMFVGMVREMNDGRAVTGIEYSAYTEMAERQIAAIAAEAAQRFALVRLAVEHRIGELAVGEASVAIAVAHAHRAPAIDGMRYIIDELKRRVPIWKREHYADGTHDWMDQSQ